MKREEKNRQTRRKIMDSALLEFAEKGYGASSINTICGNGGISKGIIYHYFETKDAIYLACVEECFHCLTEFLQSTAVLEEQSAQARLEAYFDARLSFFRDHPLYRKLFSDAVILPPPHLQEAVKAAKAPFDDFNIQVLTRMISGLRLRPDVTEKEVIDTFRQYQDYINARYQMADTSEADAHTREESCRKALNILLYGVVERG